jgi:hypothetical protein
LVGSRNLMLTGDGAFSLHWRSPTMGAENYTTLARKTVDAVAICPAGASPLNFQTAISNSVRRH